MPYYLISIALFYFKGAVAMCTGAVNSAPGLLVCRFLLGTIEAGLFPGIIYFTSAWYPRKQQAIRLGLFWSFSALAGSFGAILAFGISQMNSTKLAKWQLIFIVSF
jgi:MFS family permease